MVCGASESPSVECRSLYVLKLVGEFTVLRFWEVETGANMEVMLCTKRSSISISHHFSRKLVRVHPRGLGTHARAGLPDRTTGNNNRARRDERVAHEIAVTEATLMKAVGLVSTGVPLLLLGTSARACALTPETCSSAS